MDENIVTWFLYFVIYSFFGYFTEIFMLYTDKKQLLNRGFLFGPLIPVYGVGCLVFIALSMATNTGDNILVTFLLASVFCSIIEYLASVLLEKLFGVRLWDYAEDFKYHLHGRICLKNTVLFGFGGVIIVQWLHPLVSNSVHWLSLEWRNNLALILLVLITVDLILSVYAYFRVRSLIRSGKLDAEKMLVGDNTNEMKKLSREAVKQLFSHKESFETRVRRVLEERAKKFQSRMEKRIKNLQKLVDKSKKDFRDAMKETEEKK